MKRSQPAINGLARSAAGWQSLPGSALGVGARARLKRRTPRPPRAHPPSSAVPYPVQPLHQSDDLLLIPLCKREKRPPIAKSIS